MPAELKIGTEEELWDRIASCLQQFGECHHEGEELDQLPLGFTLPCPATQDYIDHGVLQRWAKGLTLRSLRDTMSFHHSRQHYERRYGCHA